MLQLVMEELLPSVITAFVVALILTGPFACAVFGFTDRWMLGELFVTLFAATLTIYWVNIIERIANTE